MPVRPPSRPDTAPDLDALLWELVQRYRRDVLSVYARHDLGEGDVLVLEALAQGAVTPTVLARAFGWAAPRVTLVLKHLETRELVARAQNPRDARSFRVVLTAAGRTIVNGIRTKRQERLEKILTDFTVDDREQLQLFLSQLTSAIPLGGGPSSEA